MYGPCGNPTFLYNRRRGDGARQTKAWQTSQMRCTWSGSQLGNARLTTYGGLILRLFGWGGARQSLGDLSWATSRAEREAGEGGRRLESVQVEAPWPPKATPDPK